MVNKRRSQPKVGQIFKRNISRVWARGIDLREGRLRRRIEHRLTKVSVGKGIGAVFKPHDDGMHLTHGPNTRMMDVKVYHKARHCEAKGGIECMEECAKPPGRLKDALSTLILIGRSVLLSMAHGLLGLLCDNRLNHIRNEQVTGNEGKEDRPKNNILLPVVMTFDANEHTILHAIISTILYQIICTC